MATAAGAVRRGREGATAVVASSATWQQEASRRRGLAGRGEAGLRGLSASAARPGSERPCGDATSLAGEGARMHGLAAAARRGMAVAAGGCLA